MKIIPTTYDRFFSWYANLPLEKRGVKVEFTDDKGITHKLSLYDIFMVIEKLADKRREASLDIDKWLEVVKKYFIN